MVVESSTGNRGGGMKGTPNPRKMNIGTCFICGEPCERYCHLKCAIAFDSEKQRLLDEAKITSLNQIIEEKDKLLLTKLKDVKNVSK
jgi:hypothetical protein